MTMTVYDLYTFVEMALFLPLLFFSENVFNFCLVGEIFWKIFSQKTSFLKMNEITYLVKVEKIDFISDIHHDCVLFTLQAMIP